MTLLMLCFCLAGVIGGMRPLIGGQTATPFFDALWRRSLIFSCFTRLKWRFLWAQSPQLNSTKFY